VNDTLFNIRAYKQPLRALIYEKLRLTALLGIDAKYDWTFGNCRRHRDRTFVATHSARPALVEREVEREDTTNTLWCSVGDEPNVWIQMSNAVDVLLPIGIIRSPSTLFVSLDTLSESVELAGKRWSSP
jgi:hypothetical protein